MNKIGKEKGHAEKHLILIFCSMLLPCFSSGPRIYNTAVVIGEPPVIDGQFDDPAWEIVGWNSGFIQREPHDGYDILPVGQIRGAILWVSSYER